MTTMVWVYLGYLTVCFMVTVFVARTLRIHGSVFMSERSSEAKPLVHAKTHLMVVGFYLVTFGMVGLALRFGGDASDARTAIEILSTKLGAVIFVIGFFHFVMVAIFSNPGESNKAYRSPTIVKPTKIPDA